MTQQTNAATTTSMRRETTSMRREFWTDMHRIIAKAHGSGISDQTVTEAGAASAAGAPRPADTAAWPRGAVRETGHHGSAPRAAHGDSYAPRQRPHARPRHPGAKSGGSAGRPRSASHESSVRGARGQDSA